MANTLKIKRSSVPGKVPVVGDLELGELAVNTYDGKLYTKKNDGTDSIVLINGGGGGGNFTFSNTLPADPSPGDEWLHSTTGIKYTYVDDGTSLQWVNIEAETSVSSGSSVSSLEDLSDVDLTTTAPSGGDVLTWNSTTSQWSPAAPSGGGFSNTYVLTGTTTNNTETELFVDGVANARIPVSNNTTLYYTAEIACRRTDAPGDHAAWFLKGVADNTGGTVTDVGSLYEVIVARTDTGLAVDLRASDTYNSVGVHVTGVSAKTISWRVVVTTVEV